MSWLKVDVEKPLPNDPVLAGNDKDGSPIYVARARYEEDLLPGKFVNSTRTCYVFKNNKLIPVEEFEILFGKGMNWIKAEKGKIPKTAIFGGKLKNGTNLYVGRISYKGTVRSGMINPAENDVFLPADGDKQNTINFDVLINPNKGGCCVVL